MPHQVLKNLGASVQAGPAVCAPLNTDSTCQGPARGQAASVWHKTADLGLVWAGTPSSVCGSSTTTLFRGEQLPLDFSNRAGDPHWVVLGGPGSRTFFWLTASIHHFPYHSEEEW